MRYFFYKILLALTKRLGLWVFITISWLISSGYFFFFPHRVSVSLRFYRALFPGRKYFFYLWATWKQYHNFTYVYLDRLLIQDYHNISYTQNGWEYLMETLENKKGAILLMSHLGNWEVAAQFLRGRGMKLLLYLGEEYKQPIEKNQQKKIEESGIRIIAVTKTGGSPFDLIEGLNFLKERGLVSLTGDLIWTKEQRSIRASFLGHEVLLPETPHILAALSGCPLMVFFVYRTGKEKYHITVFPPIYVSATTREERKRGVKMSAQRYATLLEEAVRDHPFEWYHFEPFLGKRLRD